MTGRTHNFKNRVILYFYVSVDGCQDYITVESTVMYFLTTKVTVHYIISLLVFLRYY